MSTEDTINELQQRLDRLQQNEAQRERAGKEQQFKTAILTRGKELEDAVDAAEKALAEAFDIGEVAEIERAQRILTEKTAAVEKFKMQVEAAVGNKGGGNLDDRNLKNWKQRHSEWYGVDGEMTKASHEIDRQIREAGTIAVGSDEYFQAIDRKMSEKFPGRISMGDFSASRGGGGGGGGYGGRIPKAVAESWARMGINMKDPKTVERMVKNRQVAVDKGILSQQIASGPVKS